MGDVNIAKFSIPINVKKAFDEGRIGEAYRLMYIVADKLAASETRRYAQAKSTERLGHTIGRTRPSDADSDQEIWRTMLVKDLHAYRMARVEYHIGNMLKLLELRLQAKRGGEPLAY